MKQPKALRLVKNRHNAHMLTWQADACAELLRLEHNNEVLMNALWKACGDDEQVVNDTIESQGELK
jgi:hypothetical protein